MADIRQVTGDFAVASQLTLADFEEMKRLGFARVINNRPDGEAPGQPTSAQAEAAAKAAGLGYVHAPFVGRPTAAAVDAAAKPGGPTLAYCRSGTRSINAWAVSQAKCGGMTADDIVKAAEVAGYDLSGLKDALRQLGAR